MVGQIRALIYEGLKLKKGFGSFYGEGAGPRVAPS